jgi:(1->4)-alpha-D-glucan 1-alpha-D-glucosylmutase
MVGKNGSDSDGEAATGRRQRRGTYRVQLNRDFDFAAVAAQAAYLSRLGVSHVYCSPITQAGRGSTHGYDVVDPTRISDDLGGVDGHRAMCDAFSAHGLAQLLDIVPNHMSIADRRNRWWWDVLADGRASPYAAFFDIDWDVDDVRLHHRVLLPVLGDQVGRVLEDGLIRLVREDGTLVVAYADSRYPLSVESISSLLEAGAGPRAAAVVAAVSSLPAAADDGGRRHRYEARNAVAAQIAAVLRDPAVAAAVDAVLADVSRDVAALDRILNEQHHRLARWRTAVEEVNYRRFFDINTLVGLRMEDPVVFAESTALITELVRRGDLDGMRIDHIDGLRRPVQYAQRLRDATGPHTWLLAEKILQRGEQPPAWSLDGTSGYDFLAAVNGLFVDPDGRDSLVALHEEVTGQPSEFAAYALDGKREVLTTLLVSDVERITGLLTAVCAAYPAHRDHTHTELRDAVVELVAAVPVYRTYIDPRTPPPADVDAATIRTAAAAAHAASPDIDERLLDFLADLFVLGESDDVATSDDDPHLAQSDLVLRLQQLCAATMAKGVEDTACYRQLVLTSLNEVGDSPAHFGMDVADFHAFNARTQSGRPSSMLATSTHDTKRSEDVRYRLDLLSELPDEWATCVRRWRDMNAVHRHEDRPDAAMEYLLYQTLVGAWPLSVERAAAYMDKAAHEAKRATSWLAPDDAYDTALRDFVEAILGDRAFVADLARFVGTLVDWGRVNSLSAALLKLTSPGVPDLYQGCELWDLSLVDPDNRRPVDYLRRTALLDAHADHDAAHAWAADRDGGAPKLLLIRDTLALRARLPEAFDERGAYLPMRAQGAFADDVIAFTRGAPAAVIAVAQRRPFRRRGHWGDTMLQLPDGEWRNVCDAQHVTGRRVALGTVLARFPVALMARVG